MPVKPSPEFDRRTLMGLAALASAAPLAAAADSPLEPDPAETVPLWPGPPPGARAQLPQEQIVDRIKTSGFQDRFVTGIGHPLLTVIRPARPNGAALIVAPGGGYVRVVIDKEGFEVGHRMAAAGITVFVLRYRLPGEGWDKAADVPLQDAQRAVRLVRAGAKGFGIDPARVAFMGFSAGGHVAASIATRFAEAVYAPVDAADALSARPDLSCPMYPVVTMDPAFAHAGSRETLLGPHPTAEVEARYSPERRVTAQTPPTFLVHAWDDATVPVENSLRYLEALRAQKIPAEAHLFAEGGHGFGIRGAQGKPAAAWLDLFLAWARRQGFAG
ncbi:MAG: alpha/beta hydrolase [Caulobacterales bacterium]|nr:alpha/beta hydrolase [Caulobacterales bacterium]